MKLNSESLGLSSVACLEVACQPAEKQKLAAKAALGSIVPDPEAFGRPVGSQGCEATSQKQKHPNSWLCAGANPAG